MSETATVVRDLTPGDEVRVRGPDVGRVAVIVQGPQEIAEVAPGVQQFVFTHESGRIIGMNRNLGLDEDDGWEACRLVVDDDGFQHALLLRSNGDVHLHTRREPGQPEDWEHRGVVEQLDPLESVDRD
jgi:hypothetical protein